jgi:phospholipid/cholesterol/gamma-HCH transport system substrate-binding protein
MRFSMRTLMKVIAFGVVCVIFTIGLGVKLANSRLFADTYELAAEFDNAQGVMKGDAVKIAGVDVGRVTKAEIEDGKALVTFNLDKDRELPADTTVGIRWRNVVGQRFLYVYPGTDDETLEEGDVIPEEQTESIADMADFLNRAGPILKAIDPSQANAFLDAMNTALGGNEASVRSLIENGESLATQLAAKDETIGSLIGSADKVMAAFASQDDEIASFITDLDAVSTMLERRTQDINSVVTNFADVQEELNNVLASNRENIDATIGSLGTVTQVLNNNRKNLKQTLDTLPMGVAGYFQTSSWGEFFNVRIIKLLVRDQEGNILVEASEADNQHGDKGGGPKTGGGNGGNEGEEDPDSATPPSPSEGVDAILRFVLTGGAS